MRSVVRVFCLLLGLATPALAQVVADRTTLNSILGASAVTADFEGFSIATGNAVNVSGVTQLDNGTLVNGQGPALVPAGVTIIFPGGGNLQWNDKGYYSAPSREILTNVNNAIEIQFTNATKAFGIDLRAFSGYTETVTATVYGADKTTVLSTIPNLSPSSSGTALFFGYQSVSGIGKVVFSQTPNNWSPIIDNLTFASIPEPPPHVLLGAGLVIVVMARRRLRRSEPHSR